MSRTRQPMGSSSFQTTTESSQDSTAHIPTLRLRAEETPTDTSEATSSSRRIRWSEDVIDNEGMGKKSSKVCCIYHKARPVGESSSEESSSSSSESDTESEDDRRTARVNGARHTHPHNGGRDAHGEHASHPDQGCCPEDHKSKPRRNRRKPSPNAYEKMPKSSRNQNQSQRHARGT